MDEEALRWVGCFYHEYYMPLPDIRDESFRLLDLPRELRDLIYDYALLGPPDRHYILAPVILSLNNEYYPSCKKRPREDLPYWGREQSTRLFRVNRQVSNESLEVFNTRFRFRLALARDHCVGGYGNCGRALEDVFSSKAKELIRIFWITLHINDQPIHSDKVIHDVLMALPYLKTIRVSIGWWGGEVSRKMKKSNFEDLLSRVVKLLTPLRNIPHQRVWRTRSWSIYPEVQEVRTRPAAP